ncbi:MAG: hypothetical protein KAJ10_17065 [Thermodesulfovibrionia bacterium]|nr:hypothetical protein [Thermodesulfovibrionia bacterium]
MILKVYDHNSYTLIGNVSEAQVMEGFVEIAGDDVLNWMEEAKAQGFQVFAFAHPEKVTTNKNLALFKRINFEKSTKPTSIFVQRKLKCFFMNESGKTVQRI